MSRIPATLERWSKKIDSVDNELCSQNGWWVYLRPGWIYDGLHQIHEDTLAQCASKLSAAEVCDCAECLELIAKRQK